MKTREIPCTFATLQTNDRFRFPGKNPYRPTYVYNGNGWWGRPYSGGPWHVDQDDRTKLMVIRLVTDNKQEGNG